MIDRFVASDNLKVRPQGAWTPSSQRRIMLCMRSRGSLSVLLAATLMLGCSGKVDSSSSSSTDLCAVHGSQPFRLADAQHARSLSASKLGLAWTEGTYGHDRVRLLSHLGDEPKTIAEAASVGDVIADDDAVWWIDASGTIHRTAPDGETRVVADVTDDEFPRMTSQSRSLLFVATWHPPAAGHVWSVDKSTGAVTTVAEPARIDSNFVADEDFIYWAQMVLSSLPDQPIQVVRQAHAPGSLPEVIWQQAHTQAVAIAVAGDSLVISPYGQYKEDAPLLRLPRYGAPYAASNKGVKRAIMIAADGTGIVAASDLQPLELDMNFPEDEALSIDQSGAVHSLGVYSGGIGSVALSAEGMFWTATQSEGDDAVYMTCRR